MDFLANYEAKIKFDEWDLGEITVPITLRGIKCGDFNGGNPALKDVYLLKGFETRLGEYYTNRAGSGYTVSGSWVRKSIDFKDTGYGLDLSQVRYKFTFIASFIRPQQTWVPDGNYEMRKDVFISKVVLYGNYNPTLNDHVMRALYMLQQGTADYRTVATFTSLNCIIEPADENEAVNIAVDYTISPEITDFTMI